MADTRSLSPFDQARRSNERWIAAFVVGAASLFALAGAARWLGGDVATGAPFTALSLLVGAYYLSAWKRAAVAPPGVGEAVLRTVLEASVGTAVMWSQASVGGDRALLNAPVILYVLATFVAILRLRPGLALLAGLLGAAEWLVTWSLLVTPAGLALDSLRPVASFERVILLALCGVLAYRIGRSLVSLTDRVARETLEREQVRRAFGAYVAEPVVERVLKGDLTLTTERRIISVLFVDIRGFTSFSEGREPGEVLDKLNCALEAFSIEVRDRGGIVNKFLGDGLMALFGAPVQEPLHASQAVQAALAIARAARELDESGVYPGLKIGIGLHCGEVVVGDIGGQGHREYTAIGDVVNVASRVESITKELGETLLITDAVRLAMGEGFELGPPLEITLRGRDEQTAVYALRLPQPGP